MKRILVPLLGQSGDRSALDAAAAFLKGHGGHIEAKLYRRNPRDVMPIVGEGFSATAIEQVMDAAEAAARDQDKSVKATFESWQDATGVTVGAAKPGDSTVTAELDSVVGPILNTFTKRGRLADLIVFARPMAQGQPDRESLLEAAMMDTGKPVLLVPDDGSTTAGRTVILAWNGSKEAARAVSIAMPVLTRADSVTVLTVKDGDVTADPQELADALKLNGVNATAAVAEMVKAGVANTLDSEAAKIKADLVVIGAYSHSRMREFIMGGVTDDMLNEIQLPVLLVH
ncbi:MAG: universal stress protein [Alphaproteobacteria bacterium]|nr:universal stress protein [Alphaproteobacteria bacterium]